MLTIDSPYGRETTVDPTASEVSWAYHQLAPAAAAPLRCRTALERLAPPCPAVPRPVLNRLGASAETAEAAEPELVVEASVSCKWRSVL